ncbi:MAG: UvrD-helicase domain-containing protein [Leptospiraceae bacterium]|nr:UvrD-helicase domain-containing protein [Leptospiraceae bacterium]MCP5500785.1 UvrD-helicase domain-containing protein [Leptospiraceae bacterium]
MILNREQREAVHHVHGPLLIFAGAGSGKTRVITNRIANLIEKSHAKGSEIVALSFTNKSAREMAERVRKMVPRGRLKGIELSTFHALGLKILKKYIEKLSYKSPFNLQTPNDLESIVGELLKEIKVDPKKLPPRLIIPVLSRIKNTGTSYIKRVEENGDEAELIGIRVFEKYEKVLKNLNSIDFDDLILLPMKLLREYKDVQEYYHNRYRFFMIDEFQDTNKIQYDFIKLLMGPNKNLCVVGDDDQSIYAFRGSDVSLILNFEKDFKDARVVKLLQNYRSSTHVLNAANSLIKNNKNRREKELWSDKTFGDKPKFVERADEKDEAIYVIDEIEKDIIRHKRKGNDIAILFRTNYQSRPFEEELRRRSIPYNLVGGYNFFDRKEVRDLISYLKVIANPKDEVSLMRILNYPKRGLGDGTISKLYEKATEEELGLLEVLQKITEEEGYVPGIKNKTVHTIYEFINLLQKYRKEFFHSSKMVPVLSNLIKELGFEKEFSNDSQDPKVVKARMMNLSELVNMMAYFESDWNDEGKPGLFDFIMKLSLLMDDSNSEDNSNDKKVQLMTMHLSKGLEFSVVYLVGLEDGIIPNSRMIDTVGDIDEERRLLYVGITRAKEKLVMTAARERKKFGESIPTQTSRFLEEINKEYLEIYQISEGDESSSGSFLDDLEKLKLV